MSDDFVKHSDLARHKSEIKSEVKEMNDAAIKHVEGIVAPLLPLAQDVAQLKEDTSAQTPILKRLARRSRKAEIERQKRSGAEEEWRKWRKRIIAILSILVVLGEAYRAWWPK